MNGGRYTGAQSDSRVEGLCVFAVYGDAEYTDQSLMMTEDWEDGSFLIDWDR